MSVTDEDLSKFVQFARARLGIQKADSLEQLVAEWTATGERIATSEAICEAIDQMDAGLGDPLNEAMEDIRRRV